MPETEYPVLTMPRGAARRGRDAWKAALLALAALACAQPAWAAAPRVKELVPAQRAVIHGRHIQFVIRFDGPVNHEDAVMQVMQGGRVVETLRPLMDSATDVLFAGGEVPAAGHYHLHWKAHAPDGTPATGDIPFSVAK